MPQRATTSRAHPARDERLGFRLDDETKALIVRAARLERRKVSDFCVQALTQAAREAVERHETLRLTQAERRAFFDLLVDPPEPNARLRQAVSESRRRVAE